MKRPLALVGCTYLLALTAAVALKEFSLYMGAACLFFYAMLLILNRHEQFRVVSLSLVTAAIAFGSFFMPIRSNMWSHLLPMRERRPG